MSKSNIIIKSVADIKREIKVGVKLACIYHHEFAGRDAEMNVLYKDKDMGIREISVVQSNSFAFKNIKADGTVSNSWCNFPKASEVVYYGNNSFTILDEDYRVRDKKLMIPILTYTFV